MAIRNTTIYLAALLALIIQAPSALGQYPYQEPFDGKHTPFIEPDYFNPDFQFFAPAEIDEYGGFPEPNVGFYFSYERLHWNVSRSEFNQPQLRPYDGDTTWGNRIEMGYMTHEDYGWNLSLVHLDGPNISRFIDTGQTIIDPITGLPVPLVNELPENQSDLTSVELTRVWRDERLYYGGFLEYSLGARYSKFMSFFQDVQLAFEVTFVDGTGAVVTETVIVDLADGTVENNMIGGVAGIRWFKHKGRWLLSASGKFIPSANFQFQANASRDEFVPLGELRLSATYELTRDFSIGSDFTLQHYGKGIGRAFYNPAVGEPRFNNDESLTIAGASLYLTLNR